MRRASIAGALTVIVMGLVPAGAGDACQEGLCPTDVATQTACRAAGVYIDLLNFTLVQSASRQAGGAPSQAADLLNANVVGITATAVQNSCTSFNTNVSNQWSCGESKIIGLTLNTGGVHIIADELYIRACSSFNNTVASGVTASFTGLKILSPGNATLMDVVPNNTTIPLGPLGTLYLDETSSGSVGLCQRNRGNSLRLENPIVGTIIVGSVATNACTPAPQ